MTAADFEEKVAHWARNRPDIKALVQIGSRAMGPGHFDQWSDWDYHIISSNPQSYHGVQWVEEIAPAWCVNAERSIRGRIKVSVVFQGGLEADFVPLCHWQMRLLYWAMARPSGADRMPRILRNGISEMRVILLNSGYRVLKGGAEWERRLGASRIPWKSRRMSFDEFNRHQEAFWQKAVWVAKKIARPELRSAAHWLHRLILQHVYALLEEEAWLAGKGARPEALKAEKWLTPQRLAQTDIHTSLDQGVLATGLLKQIELFIDVSAAICRQQGYTPRDYSPVIAWLRSELQPLASRVRLPPSGR